MEVHEIVAEWVRFARQEYESALHLFETKHPQPLELICNLTQQAVEKMLKAFLIAQDSVPPRTHDLNQLCELCEAFDSRFEGIAPQCSSLTKYGVMAKYPFELEILEDETAMALQRAKAVLQFIVAVMEWGE